MWPNPEYVNVPKILMRVCVCNDMFIPVIWDSDDVSYHSFLLFVLFLKENINKQKTLFLIICTSIFLLKKKPCEFV